MITQLPMKTLFSSINPYYDGEGEEHFAQAVYNNRIVEDYYVSNKGRVFCTRLGRFLAQSPDKDGYMRVSLVIDGKSKTIKTHRLVLMTFCPIENPEKYDGNHLDGMKDNNDYDTNLEWATKQDNTRHGWDTGLNTNKGEGNVTTVVKDAEVHIICQLLEQGLRNCEICDAFNKTDKVDRMRFNTIVSSIRHLESHRDISRQYDIPGSKGRDRYSLEFAELVCQFLYNKEGDRTYSDVEIMDLLEIPDEDRPKFKVYLNDLRAGRTAKEVTEKYRC